MASNIIPQSIPNTQKNSGVFALLHWVKAVIRDARRLERIGVK